MIGILFEELKLPPCSEKEQRSKTEERRFVFRSVLQGMAAASARSLRGVQFGARSRDQVRTGDQGSSYRKHLDVIAPACRKCSPPRVAVFAFLAKWQSQNA